MVKHVSFTDFKAKKKIELKEGQWLSGRYLVRSSERVNASYEYKIQTNPVQGVTSILFYDYASLIYRYSNSM